MFRTQILVRFGDLDPAGIAYYPNLVNFLHESFEDFFSGYVGRPYPEVFREGFQGSCGKALRPWGSLEAQGFNERF